MKSFFPRSQVFLVSNRDSDEVISFLDLKYFSHQIMTRMKSFFSRSQVFLTSKGDSNEVTSFLDLKYFSHQKWFEWSHCFLNLEYFSHQNVTRMKFSKLSLVSRYWWAAYKAERCLFLISFFFQPYDQYSL